MRRSEASARSAPPAQPTTKVMRRDAATKMMVGPKARARASVTRRLSVVRPRSRCSAPPSQSRAEGCVQRGAPAVSVVGAQAWPKVVATTATTTDSRAAEKRARGTRAMIKAITVLEEPE